LSRETKDNLDPMVMTENEANPVRKDAQEETEKRATEEIKD